MIKLVNSDLSAVSGGNLLESIKIASSTYTQTARLIEQIQPSFVEATKIYIKIGHLMGEHFFALTHPEFLNKKGPFSLNPDKTIH